MDHASAESWPRRRGAPVAVPAPPLVRCDRGWQTRSMRTRVAPKDDARRMVWGEWSKAISRLTRSMSTGRRLFGAVTGLVLVALLAACSGQTSASTSADATDDWSISPGTLDKTSMPPWPAPADVARLVTTAGLDLGPMGRAAHYHPLLQVFVDGQQVAVPANIGIDPETGAMSALHTHTADGVIHIEADHADETFTLGQFFTEWGLVLTSKRIGGVRAAPGRTVEITVNGASYDGDPASLRLEPDQQIVVRVG
jgi:hypothetical protein